ncbi:hypothetical protein G5714_006249 [Onychostoma macrolepis]|uniref:Uncharacterized protein n=1 Tax=Onychostoma macrolepis TaxID=369639 RepID=A0A7J6D3H5_9TELE|nr:hypothetical protein G5714_006249 [Onychostoma macrolepis]
MRSLERLSSGYRRSLETRRINTYSLLRRQTAVYCDENRQDIESMLLEEQVLEHKLVGLKRRRNFLKKGLAQFGHRWTKI